MAIMMASGLEQGEIIESAIDIGVDGYITKPFEKSQLLVSVELALSHRRLSLERDDHRRQLERAIQDRTVKLKETVRSLSTARRESEKAELLFKGLFTNAKVGIIIGRPSGGRQRLCHRRPQPGRRSHPQRIQTGCAAMSGKRDFPAKRDPRAVGMGPHRLSHRANGRPCRRHFQ